jgi:uncharacterized protein YycO
MKNIIVDMCKGMKKQLIAIIIIIVTVLILCEALSAADPTTSADQNFVKKTNPDTTKNSQPIASFQIDPDKPMVGGNIKFNASSSKSPDGSINKYEWDFESDGVKDATGIITYHEYLLPKKYQATLTIYDDKGFTSSITKNIDLSLLPGDIILTRRANSYVPGDSWLHAGIIISSDESGTFVMEALGSGVTRNSIKEFFYPELTYVGVFRVNTDPITIQQAVSFANAQQGKPYDLLALISQGLRISNKRLTSNSWYCSELVWAAYMNASNKTIDLDTPLWGNAVHPEELVMKSNLISLVGAHKEYKPSSGASQQITAFISRGSVDFSLTSPNGQTLSQSSSQIDNGHYHESDLDKDGNIEDIAYITGYSGGNYNLDVNPENKTSGGSYSINLHSFSADGQIKTTNIIQNRLVTPNTQSFTIKINDKIKTNSNKNNLSTKTKVNGEMIGMQETGNPLFLLILAFLLVLGGILDIKTK